VLGKLDVNGDNAAPVWTFLKEQQPGIIQFSEHGEGDAVVELAEGLDLIVRARVLAAELV
jgi:glutathione peroxidase-family protein